MMYESESSKTKYFSSIISAKPVPKGPSPFNSPPELIADKCGSQTADLWTFVQGDILTYYPADILTYNPEVVTYILC